MAAAVGRRTGGQAAGSRVTLWPRASSCRTWLRSERAAHQGDRRLDPGHGGEADSEFGGQEPGRPVRHPQLLRWVALIGEGGHHHRRPRRLAVAGRCAAGPPALGSRPSRSDRASPPRSAASCWSAARSRRWAASTASNTIRARCANPACTELDRVNASNRDRSPSRRISGAATDMVHCLAPPTVNRVSTGNISARATRHSA